LQAKIADKIMKNKSRVNGSIACEPHCCTTRSHRARGWTGASGLPFLKTSAWPDWESTPAYQLGGACWSNSRLPLSRLLYNL